MACQDPKHHRLHFELISGPRVIQRTNLLLKASIPVIQNKTQLKTLTRNQRW